MKNLLTVSQAVSRPPVNTEMVPQTRPHFSTWELAPEGARRSPSFSEPRPQQGAEGLRAHPPPFSALPEASRPPSLEDRSSRTLGV